MSRLKLSMIFCCAACGLMGWTAARAQSAQAQAAQAVAIDQAVQEVGEIVQAEENIDVMPTTNLFQSSTALQKQITAATAQNVPGVANNPITAINNLIAGYGTSEIQDWLLQLPYNFAQSSLGSSTMPIAQASAGLYTTQKTSDVVKNYLLAPETTGSSGSIVPSAATKATQQVANIPATDFYTASQGTSTQAPAPNNHNLDFAGLADVLQYDSAQTAQLINQLKQANINVEGVNVSLKREVYTAKEAENYALALSHLGGIPSGSLVPNLQDEKSKKTAYGDPVFQAYMTNLRAFETSQAMALNNLQFLIEQRKPISGLGSQAGLQEPDVSPLRLDYLVSTLRLQKSWYENMVVASPAAVEREMLFVLAEIRYELFQMRLENQRILAATTATQIQNNVNYRNTALLTACNNLPAAYGCTATTNNPAAKQASGQVGSSIPTSVPSS